MLAAGGASADAQPQRMVPAGHSSWTRLVGRSCSEALLPAGFGAKQADAAMGVMVLGSIPAIPRGGGCSPTTIRPCHGRGPIPTPEVVDALQDLHYLLIAGAFRPAGWRREPVACFSFQVRRCTRVGALLGDGGLRYSARLEGVLLWGWEAQAGGGTAPFSLHPESRDTRELHGQARCLAQEDHPVDLGGTTLSPQTDLRRRARHGVEGAPT